jgi:hypothetical protein
LAPVEVVTDEEERQDEEMEWEGTAAEEYGEGETEGCQEGKGETDGEEIGEEDAGDGPEEDAKAGLAFGCSPHELREYLVRRNGKRKRRCGLTPDFPDSLHKPRVMNIL